MFLHQLYLQNFRSFSEKKINFSPKMNLIIGPNAAGKTNLLEAIYLLSIAKSFRGAKEEEMILNAKEMARINCQLSNQQKLEIILTKGKIQSKRTAKKIYKVNQVNKQWRNFVGFLPSVLFRPEDIDLVLGPPSIRRNYLDFILNQVDWQYRVCSLAYRKGLRQRNKLLSRIREGQAQKSQLTFWNQLLIKNGQIITQKRKELIDFFNNFLTNVFLVYDKSVISLARLEKYSQAEIALGITLVGPQRDNITFKKFKSLKSLKTGRNLAVFGSRGEQRMAILALKLAELAFIEKKTQVRPILLLDDIFSELDKTNRKKVGEIIKGYQRIITATEIDLLSKKQNDKIKIFNI